MQYRDIKGLILIIPTLTIGLWEYVRHQLLLPYVSMELGNVLAPFIVFGVTVTLLRKLFRMMEATQEELQRERAATAALTERERIARELHDGIAQSLFLLAVKVDRMDKANEAGRHDAEQIGELRKTVRQVNDYVRQAIANLRDAPAVDALPWMESVIALAREFERDTGISTHFDWTLPEERLSAKEKIELYASVREALSNVRKHAGARQVWIACCEEVTGWRCRIADDGEGIVEDAAADADRFGLRIMRERAEEMGWTYRFGREDERTVLVLGREEGK